MDKLLENGLELIVESIELLRGAPNPKDVRNAVIFLSIGIELIVKEGLVTEHWSLVFDDPKKAAAEKWKSGDFYTVGFAVGIERLRKITGKPMSYIEGFDGMREIRNDLEHKGILPDMVQMKGAAAEALAAAIKLIADVSTDYSEYAFHFDGVFEPALLTSIKKGLVDFEEFTTRRFNEIEPLLADRLLFKCPSCRQKAVTLGGSQGIKCQFCLNHVSLYGLALRHRDSLLCPCCDHPTFLYGRNEQSQYAGCFSCASEWKRAELVTCSGCENPVREGELKCSHCNGDRQDELSFRYMDER